MRKHELDVVLDRGPQCLTVCMCINDELSGAVIEISQEVSEDVDRCLFLGQQAETHSIHVEPHGAWPKTQLEPLGASVGDEEERGVLTARPLTIPRPRLGK